MKLLAKDWSKEEIRWKSEQTPEDRVRYVELAAFFDKAIGKPIVLTDCALYPKDKLNVDADYTLVLDGFDPKTRRGAPEKNAMSNSGPRRTARQARLEMPEQASAPEKSLPLPGEVFRVQGHEAFVIMPEKRVPKRSTPWVWYAPTLPGLPGVEERWMFERFLQAGIAVAGIDVGESYGSPDGRSLFTDLYRDLTRKRGFSRKPVMLGRSRGGLMTLCWAAENPDKVGGFAGIYPVCNIASYPGLRKAAGAYHLTEEELSAHLAEHNPVDRLARLAKAHTPLFAIHGDVDTVVPLPANSGLLKERYEALGGKIQLIVPAGQGHNMWPGFFQCQELVDFVLKNARP